ncbi:MAG: hypothetical protein HOV92_41105, partial [Streptomyces sp.]|nr:hypothetical protein [Streptomyces sp.]
MDYCLPCRRHLNGALACPGCGTSVEQLRAYATQPAQQHAQQYAQQPQQPMGDGAYQAYDGGGYADTAYGAVSEAAPEALENDETPHGESYAESHEEPREEPEVVTGGRAARRRAQGRRGRAPVVEQPDEYDDEGDLEYDDEGGDEDGDGPAGAGSRRDRKAAAHRRRRRRVLLVAAGFVLA